MAKHPASARNFEGQNFEGLCTTEFGCLETDANTKRMIATHEQESTFGVQPECREIYPLPFMET